MTAWNCARVFSRCTNARREAGQRRAGSDSQALAALGAACVDDGAAATGLHADQKAVGACAPHFGRLVGAFHVRISGKPTIIAEIGKGNKESHFQLIRKGEHPECLTDPSARR